MYMHWMNTMVGYCGPFKFQTDYCQKLKNYIETNLAWMEQQMEAGESSEYWYQVCSFLSSDPGYVKGEEQVSSHR